VSSIIQQFLSVEQKASMGNDKLYEMNSSSYSLVALVILFVIHSLKVAAYVDRLWEISVNMTYDTCVT